MRHEIAELLGEASFSIRKWVSHDISVLANIPCEEIATSVNIDDNKLPSVKTLGMVWDAEIHSYLYSINLPKVADLTKRAVFSASAIIRPSEPCSPIYYSSTYAYAGNIGSRLTVGSATPRIAA